MKIFITSGSYSSLSPCLSIPHPTMTSSKLWLSFRYAVPQILLHLILLMLELDITQFGFRWLGWCPYYRISDALKIWNRWVEVSKEIHKSLADPTCLDIFILKKCVGRRWALGTYWIEHCMRWQPGEQLMGHSKLVQVGWAWSVQAHKFGYCGFLCHFFVGWRTPPRKNTPIDKSRA